MLRLTAGEFNGYRQLIGSRLIRITLHIKRGSNFPQEIEIKSAILVLMNKEVVVLKRRHGDMLPIRCIGYFKIKYDD
jgi:hypothetical protein